MQNSSQSPGLPPAQGLYDPRNEHDNCGMGFVANMRGEKSHQMIEMGIEVLIRLTHRGASGCDPETGDGAGILIQIPHEFFAAECQSCGFTLPEPGAYAVGMVFLPVGKHQRLQCEGIVERIIREEGLTVLGWRDIPCDGDAIGREARSTQPYIQQVFLGRPEDWDEGHFERKLYVTRKRIEHEIASSEIEDRHFFYIPSFSSRTIVYKGLLLAPQIANFYGELADPRVKSALCVVHQRFSTNTFPSWPLAHPYRYIAHNGEINTLRGNVNWMKARESLLASPLFGEDMQKLFPIVTEGGSDSAAFDSAVELLFQSGRSLPHVMAMLIPEAWSGNPHMDADRQAFYEYHASLMEPWDGPAAMAFTDGRLVGAMLDRNGLRPGRYVVTNDDIVVLASEAGVVDIPAEKVRQKGRLQPGKMFLVDTVAGRIIPDEELKEKLTSRQPYAEWIRENQITLEQMAEPGRVHALEPGTLQSRQRAFGYTEEDLKMILAPMAAKGEEPVGSMGTDTPLACLSDRPQLLFNYFKQLFAQVTNPPIDPIREEMVMSLISYIGTERNILEETPRNCHTLKMPQPVLTNRELEQLRRVSTGDLLATTLVGLFRSQDGEAGLKRGLEELCQRASLMVRNGYTLLIISDRGVDKQSAPIPSLLALAAVHNLLVREGTRTQVALIIESGEPREVMHFALLIGYGASAVNPYLAIESIESLANQGRLPGTTPAKAVANFIKGINKGLLKTFSKMGVSTLQSYRGAQIFEAIGLSRELIDSYFAGTVSRIEGVGLGVLAQEARMRHEYAFQPVSKSETELSVGGAYQFRVDGEYHSLNPLTISKLQHAVRASNPQTFKEYTDLIDEQNKTLCTLRGLMKIKLAKTPLPLEEIEPATEIVKRFMTGAMSFGSISKEAHETLAIAMNRIGGKSNTGEGGEDEERFTPDANGDLRRSAVKQIASGRFGVTTNYLVHADELQIKMAQGAKPGEGGQLPGHKVDEVIARLRHSTPGVTLISPPPHHDIYSIEDLSQLIFDLKNVNPSARIAVKLVAEVGVGTVAAGVSKAHADVVLVSGDTGGTGAAPLSSLKHAGIPWELGLAETQQVLLLNDLRSRIRVQTDGKLQTGRDVVIATLLGAEEFGFATAPLIAMGCIMMRKCHLNTCPVGIATQDPVLRQHFAGQPEHVINFFFYIAEQVRELMAQIGFRTMDEMVGRVDRLETRPAIAHWKASGLDLSQILYNPPLPERVKRHCVHKQDHGLDSVLDLQLIEMAKDALENGAPVEAKLTIRNVHRSVGAMLGGEIARRYGSEGLPDETVRFWFRGSAGQSFAAFLPRGVTLTLEGEANDYVGKGLSGGRVVIYPPKNSGFLPEESILAGNVVLYGATSGEVFLNGVAGERFAVRNSGASAVVEGVGDHGCEYMTNGLVVVLGACGRNFAAGMSGGVAYVLDESGEFARTQCNQASVDLEAITEADDIGTLRNWIERHLGLTGSPRAAWILDNWSSTLPKFVKVFPHELRRVLSAAREKQSSTLEPQHAGVLVASAAGTEQVQHG
ncbi:Glutamate synthase [NADPH] large chain [Acidisarcina polymorpha]|uniref:Glutamate synthase [NADPH] large chain n=1 Tax=Acidisarcina polymorpha TaxID=2211140 RepID=A0A2Z5G673_9BACT|nr:glutamate synthase large subunit [Acidisarcina polymorpha]AXC14601.1 Glutamate synthase [NADPH] large chain [Acidisarcina polymorpha]